MPEGLGEAEGEEKGHPVEIDEDPEKGQMSEQMPTDPYRFFFFLFHFFSFSFPPFPLSSLFILPPTPSPVYTLLSCASESPSLPPLFSQSVS